MLHVRNETGRRFRPAGQLPSEGIKKPARLRGFRIVEALSVKVLGKSRAACALLYKSRFILVEPLASVQTAALCLPRDTNPCLISSCGVFIPNRSASLVSRHLGLLRLHVSRHESNYGSDTSKWCQTGNFRVRRQPTAIADLVRFILGVTGVPYNWEYGDRAGKS